MTPPIPRNPEVDEAEEPERLITTAEAAALLSMAANTLAKGRMQGNRRHPPHVRIGRAVRYSTRDLSAFIRSRTIDHGARTAPSRGK